MNTHRSAEQRSCKPTKSLKADTLNVQRSGFQSTTRNTERSSKSAISLFGAETRRGRTFVGDFSGRRLLFGATIECTCGGQR